MKRLIIIRHGKASLTSAVPGGDFNRPLIEHGIARTEKLIEFLKKNKEKADLIVSSPATRAKQTAEIIASGIKYPKENIRYELDIYAEHEERIFDILYQRSNEVSTLFLIGHNPTLTNFLNYWINPKVDMFKTSGAACLVFETDDWSEITRVACRLEYLYPQSL
jgi:phosphohistidine phosphatase